MNSSQFNKILVVKHGSLGDIAFSILAMASIKQFFNNATIDLLTEEKYVNFLISSQIDMIICLYRLCLALHLHIIRMSCHFTMSSQKKMYFLPQVKRCITSKLGYLKIKKEGQAICWNSSKIRPHHSLISSMRWPCSI